MKYFSFFTASLALASTALFSAPQKFSTTKDSQIGWIGKKVTGQHEGTISLKDGIFTVENQNITGGNFVMDMNSISVTDLKDQEDNAKLVGHLKSDDFFAVKEFGTATFVIKSLKPITSGGTHEVTGDLTVRGKTEEIKFPATIKLEGNNLSLKATALIDRTKFNVRYNAKKFLSLEKLKELADRIIEDNFEIKLDVKAVAAK